MSELRYDGKVAIITGAGAGIGRQYALLLASRGAKVVVNDLGGSTSGEGANQRAADIVVEEIKQAGGEAVADYNSVVDGDKVVQTAVNAFGTVHIIINNAGILRDVSFQKMNDKDWDLIMAVHVTGPKNITRAAWPYMREQKYGRLVMVTSVAGMYGNFGQANYSCAKTSMIGFAKTLAKEGKNRNIKVNVVAPGAGSRMTANIMPEEMVNAWKAEYVAPAVAFLVHEEVPCSGCVFENGGGFVAEVKWNRSPGHYFDIDGGFTVEDIQKHWGDVTNMNGGVDPELDDNISAGQLKGIMSKL